MKRTILTIISFYFFISLSICAAFENPPLIPVTKPVGGNTWVVGSGGDFSTIENADSSGSIGPGDIIRIKAGTYTVGAFNKNGTSGNPIYWEAYGNGQVTILPGGSDGRVSVYAHDIVIDGGQNKEIVFDFNGHDPCYGLYPDSDYGDAHHITIYRVILEKAVGPFQKCVGSSGNGLMRLRASNTRIYNCEFRDTVGYALYIRGGDNIELRNNIFADVSKVGTQANPHTGEEAVDELHISGNIYKNVGRGSCDGDNVKNAIALLSSASHLEDVYVYNNIVFDSYGGIKKSDPVGSNCNIRIYNNTVYNNDTTGLYTKENGTCIVRNNLSWNNGSNDSFHSSTILSNNILNNSGSDPRFVSIDPSNDHFLQLASDSTAIEQGVDMSSEGVTDDYFGNPRPYPSGGSYDIGAHEYSNGPDTNPPNAPTNLRYTQIYY